MPSQGYKDRAVGARILLEERGQPEASVCSKCFQNHRGQWIGYRYAYEGPFQCHSCGLEIDPRSENPLEECHLGPARCRLCLKAENEQTPIVRSDVAHSPSRANPGHRRGRKRNPTFTSVRIWGDNGEDGGAWFVAPGDYKRVEYIKGILREMQKEEPTAGWHLETRGEGAPWHRWDGGGRLDNPALLLLGNPAVMLLRKEDRKNLPPLYSQEHNPDPTVWVKFFTPYSSYSFFITEFDGDDTFFGWTDPGPGGDAELGYTSLSELAALKGPGGTQGVERDRWWKPVPLSKVKSREANPPLPGRWNQNGEYHCTRCGTIVGKSLRDLSPHGTRSDEVVGSAHQHERECAAAPGGKGKYGGLVRPNPSAPSRIKNAWEKFHQKGFTGKVKEIEDIPGTPADLMALGEFVDATTESGKRWSGGKGTRLCYEPSDKSLWVIALSGMLHTGRTRGEGLATVAYRTFGDSGKDHAVYEHRFHAPLPTLEVVSPRAVLLQGGRYTVTDWIRK